MRTRIRMSDRAVTALIALIAFAGMIGMAVAASYRANSPAHNITVDELFGR